jgi:hypothetical protein
MDASVQLDMGLGMKLWAETRSYAAYPPPPYVDSGFFYNQRLAGPIELQILPNKGVNS